MHRRSLINLSQKIQPKNLVETARGKHLRNDVNPNLRVILNDKITVHYDTHDSWEVNEELLNQVDCYFKRSFSSARLQKLGENYTKIYPLGLNYAVSPNGVDKFALQRTYFLETNWKHKLKEIISSFDLFKVFSFTPRVRIMESLPDYEAHPKILFMAPLHGLYDDPKRTEEKVEERLYINRTRANCIKLLREEFKENFLGGFIHTSFATRNYGDLLIPDPHLALKPNYISLAKSYPICVATTGLHGSIGWKFAEYIALSRAVLTEKLNYEVPGPMREGENYLEFNSPEMFR